MSIQKDLALGQAGEKILRAAIRNLNMSYESGPTGKFSDYDGTIDVKGFQTSTITCEVKYDIMGVKTGNIAIEMFNPVSGKPSGLGITKADIWVHILDDVWAVKVSELKKWIDANKPNRIISAAGDGNATIYLYPHDKILSIFTQLDGANNLKDAKKWLLKVALDI